MLRPQAFACYLRFAPCFHGICECGLNPFGRLTLKANDPVGFRMTRRNRTAIASSAQPDLFSFVGEESVGASIDSCTVMKPLARDKPKGQSPVIVARVPTSATSPPVHPKHARAQTRVVSFEDLPAYPQLDQDLVDQSIAALPAGKMWFTYQAIRECFGVSRATVARRVKKGLVPGIRFSGNSVIEDGSVRRFDRTQLRWLLLSVRSQRPQ